MSDENSAYRRRLKQNMRRRVQPELDADGRERVNRSASRNRMSGMVRMAVLILFGILFVFVFRGLGDVMQYKNYSIVSEAEEQWGQAASFEEFGDYILKITTEGIACLDHTGTSVWNSGYSMTNPQVVTQGSYGAVADIKSSSAVIFDETGVLGTVSANLPILNATMSDHGVLALVLDDSDANTIAFYDSTGAALDIKIKTTISGDGFPLDLALSPTGTGLITSVVYVDQNSMQNQVVFYNFDVGQSDSNCIVGYYSYGDSMFPEVAYMTDSVALAFGDDQLNLYSMRNETQPSLIRNIPMEGQIYSVFYDRTQIGVICQTDTVSRMLCVYDTSGKLKYQKEIDFEYSKAEFSDGCAVVYGSADCMIVNSRGRARYEGTLDTYIRKIIVTGNNTCLVVSNSSIRKIRFH